MSPSPLRCILLAALLAGCLQATPGGAPGGPTATTPGSGGEGGAGLPAAAVGDAALGGLPSPIHNLTFLRLDGGAPTQATEGPATLPRFLDARRVAHNAMQGAALHDVASGRSRVLGEGELVAAGSGMLVVAREGASTLHALDAEGGASRLLDTLPQGCRAVGSGALSPDGRLLVVTMVCDPVPTHARWVARLRLVDLANASARDLGLGEHPSFAPDGRLLRVDRGNVTRLDLASGAVETLKAPAPGTLLGRHLVDAQGRLWQHVVFLNATGHPVRDELRVRDAAGAERVVVDTARFVLLDYDVSPDGATVALSFVRDRTLHP